MKLIQQVTSRLTLCTAFALASCSGNSSIKVVYQGQNCGIDTVALRQLENIEQISALKPQLIPLSEQTHSTEPSLPQIDLSKNHLALIALGQKSTAGYNLDGIAEQVKIKDKVLHLPVNIQKPSKAIVAQMITTPCAVISLKKLDYTAIVWGEKKLELK